MKKIILSSIFAFALLASVGFGVNKSMKNNANLSDLALANVEALADGESGEGKLCHDAIKTYPGVQTFYCGTCDYVENSIPSFWSKEKTC